MTTSTEGGRGISFEFFPPRTEAGREKLLRATLDLARYRPDFFSVTYGAGGSTQARSQGIALQLHHLPQRAEYGFEVAPHISCIGSVKAQLARMLDDYQQSGIRRLVAVRGDTPSGMVDIGDFHHAEELVRFIREHSGGHFHIEVAAYPETHPQSDTAAADLKNFQRKVAAGANSAITQYFFNTDAYADFVRRAEALGVTIPIYPGVMPMTNYQQLARFSAVCGAEIPRWLHRRLQGFGDDLDSLRAFGVDFTAGFCRRLLELGAPGLHFYTLNQAGPCLAVLREILPSHEASRQPLPG